MTQSIEFFQVLMTAVAFIQPDYDLYIRIENCTLSVRV